MNELQPIPHEGGLDQQAALFRMQADERLAKLHFLGQLLGRLQEYLGDKAFAIEAAEELATPRSHFLDLPFRMFKRAAVPVTALALFGVGSTGAFSSRSEGDNSAHVFQTEGLSSSWREAFLARGLNLDVEAQQNPEFYYPNVSFIDNLGRQRFLGVTAYFGIPPNHTEVPIGTVDDFINGVRTRTFQLNGPFYPELSPQIGGLASIDSVTVNNSKGMLYMGVALNLVGNRYFLRGGEIVSDYNDPGNLSKRFQITSEGIGHIETDGNFSPLSIITEGSNQYLTRDARNALNPSHRGIYRILLGSDGKPTGSWIKQDNVTPTPTPSATPTSTPTRVPGIGVRGTEFRVPTDIVWQDEVNETGYLVVRAYNGPPTLAPNGNLERNVISYRDPTVLTSPACYIVFAVNGSSFIGYSDFYCLFPNTKSSANAPEGFRIGYDSGRARLSWTSSSSESYSLGVLRNPPQPPIPVPPGLGTITHETGSSAACYTIFNTTGGTIRGNTDIACVVPLPR